MTTVFMPNGEMEMLLNSNDLVYLVDKQIGFEAKQMLEEIVSNGDKAKHLADSDFRNYEIQLEENHSGFEDLSYLINKASEELNKDRMNKAKLKDIISKMENLVNQNL